MTSSPKIIHFKLYNLRLREWHPLVTRLWPQAVALTAAHRMVIVYRDRIDALPCPARLVSDLWSDIVAPNAR